MEAVSAAKGRALKVLAVLVGLGILGAGGWYGYSLVEEVHALRDRVDELEGETDDLSGMTVDLVTDTLELRSQVRSLDVGLDNLEDEIGGYSLGGSLMSRVNDLEALTDDLEARTRLLGSDYVTLDAKVQRLSHCVQAHETRLDGYHSVIGCLPP